MQYNLLNYGNITTYCTSINNNVNEKAGCLKTIVKYVNPDIFGVNEIAANSYFVQHVLDNALNTDGVTWYKKATLTNLSGSSIVNMLFYNSNKFVLHTQFALATNTRDFNFYTLYFNAPDLAITNDTAFFTVIICHLKAGSYTSDITERSNMTNILMNYLNAVSYAGQFMLMGDFNVKSSTEPAYQNLVNHPNPSIRFYDPLNSPNNWNDDSLFALIHTQSTHATSNNCAASGGLDDQFDFILANEKMLNGNGWYQYIAGSYNALGQDGLHFNKAVNNPVNNAVPDTVANALYDVSDHLPVLMDLVLKKSPNAIENIARQPFLIKFANPVNATLDIYLKGKSALISVEIFNAPVQKIYTNIFSLNNELFITIPFTHMPQGIYFLKIADNEAPAKIFKFIKL